MRIPNWLKTLFYLFLVIGALINLLRPFKEYFEFIPVAFLFKYFVLPIAVLVPLIILFAAYRILKTRRGLTVYHTKREQRMKPLEETLEKLTSEDVYTFADDIATRWDTYDLLRKHGLTEFFPEEFNTVERAAEGKLVSWLELPNELGAVPDLIEHVENVTIAVEKKWFGEKDLVYRVFRFRIYEPHWAARNGWMRGVVGPYSTTAEPYDWPAVTFSRLNMDHEWEESGELPEVAPQEEALWVHENITVRHYQNSESESV